MRPQLLQVSGASRPFPIERGVKQGNPIRPLLFPAVIQVIVR